MSSSAERGVRPGAQARFVALPLLAAAGPVLYLWGENAETVRPADAVVPLAATVGVALMSLGVAVIAVRDVSRAALSVTALMVLVLSFGYRLDAVSTARAVDWQELRWWLAGVDAVVFAVVLAVLWRLKAPSDRVLDGLLVVAALFAALSLPKLASSFSGPLEPEAVGPAAAGDSPSRPDIYYIVLDGYARHDVLAEIYGQSNEPFLKELERRGFYIARESLANYTRTHLSLASSLNMRYVDDLPPNLTPDAGRELRQLLQYPRAISTLQEHGYQYVHFDTIWWGTSDAPLADVRYGLGQASEFEAVYLQTTMPGRLLPLPAWQEDHLETLAALPTIARMAEPTIAFAHVLFPHPPFVLDEDGRLLGRDAELGGSWDNHDGYLRQLRFVNRWLISTLDSIRQASSKEPIVVVQSDHGPWSTAGVTHDPALARWERTAILNAYLVPGELRTSLYPSISPVNTFRVLVRGVLGVDLPLLPDRSMFSPTDTDPRIDVTEELRNR